MRIAFWISRSGPAALVSHLDMHRAMGRALRRSGLPIAYSQGFNPHIQLSFALAVPVGIAFDENWMDVTMSRDVFPEEAYQTLLPHMPPGVELIAAVALEQSGPTLMPLVTRAAYRIDGLSAQDNEALGTALQILLAAEEYTIIKKTKSGRKPVNIRPMVHGFTPGEAPEMLLSAGSEGGLNPLLLLTNLLPGLTSQITLTRLVDVRTPLGMAK